ncbi:hypothetical protein IAD21_00621 [Abditibacteriota bacterium]|nr:hypothetical protein IAD21_00621 [Abditibacteriota bacterium]
MATIKNGVPRAVILTRVSSEGQTEGTSLAGQFAACAKRAQEEGAIVIAVFEEVKSGGLYESREQLQKALTLIESGEAQMLILAKLDRTGRDTDALRDIRRRVEAVSARLVFADGMSFEKGAVGNLMFTQLSAFAEFEREMIKERVVAGQLRLAASGRIPAPTAPYGYYIWLKSDVTRGLCQPQERGTYVLNEEEAKWIKPIFERVAAHESTRSVAAWLQREGAPTRTGVDWIKETVSNIIVNPAYVGRPTWRKNKRATDESRARRGLSIYYNVGRPQSEQFVFEAPRLVSDELWARANEAIQGGNSTRSGPKQTRRMLSGLLACPLCGKRMHSTSTVQKYSMYKCTGAWAKHSAVSAECTLPSVIGSGSSGLEVCVIAALSEFFASPVMAQNAIVEFQSHQKEKSHLSGDEVRLKQIEREITTCHQKEEFAATREIENMMKGQDGSVFIKVRETVAQKRANLEIEQSALIARRALIDLEPMDIEQDIAQELMAALNNNQLTGYEKNILLFPFIKIIYPRILPPELRVSAKVWRARGCPEPVESDGRGHPYARHLGGCDIILRFGKDVVFILSRHIVRWESHRDIHRNRSIKPVWETSIKVEEKNPFPLDWRQPSLIQKEQN